MSWNSVLQEYALNPKPETIPPSIRVAYTPNTLAVFDKFNKAKYHLLLLPRPSSSWNKSSLLSLKNVLRSDKAAAKVLLETLRDESKAIVSMIEDEMTKTYGCTWKINIGFHAVPSMDHVHLHIISDDLVSDKLKHKKHYNSFHPTLGFFLHLDDVLGWFDLPDAEFKKKASLRQDDYEPLLRRDLRSWRTGEMFKTMPKLKAHLEEAWSKETKQCRLTLAKRKRDVENDDDDDDNDDDDVQSKGSKTRKVSVEE